MLVISVKEGHSVSIGDDVTIYVTRMEPGRVRLGIDAPEEIQIVRSDARDTSPKARRR